MIIGNSSSDDDYKTKFSIKTTDSTTNQIVTKLLEITITKDEDGNLIPYPNFFVCCRKGDHTTLKLLIEGFKHGTLTMENILANNNNNKDEDNNGISTSFGISGLNILTKIASFFYGGRSDSSNSSSSGASTNFLSPHGKNRSFQRSPLHYACRFGHLECVKLLVELPQLQLLGETCNKWTIVHECARFGRVEVLAFLFSHPKTMEYCKAMCSKPTKFGSTPLHLSCKHRYSEASQFLSSQFIPFDKISVSRQQSFLHVAIEEKLKPFVVDFLSRFMANSPLTNMNRKTIVSIVELICSKDHFKTNTLHYAAVKPSDKMYETLLTSLTILHEYMENAGIVRNLVSLDYAGNSVLHYAMGGNCFKCASLVYHYYLLSIYRSNPNSIVITNRTTNTNHELLHSNNNPMNTQSGVMRHSPLFLACKYNHSELLKKFLMFYKDESYQEDPQKHLQSLFEEGIDSRFSKTSLYDFLRIKSREEFEFILQSWKQIKVTGVVDKMGHSPARVVKIDESDEELHDLFEVFNKWKIESSSSSSLVPEVVE